MFVCVSLSFSHTLSTAGFATSEQSKGTSPSQGDRLEVRVLDIADIEGVIADISLKPEMINAYVIIVCVYVCVCFCRCVCVREKANETQTYTEERKIKRNKKRRNLSMSEYA